MGISFPLVVLAAAIVGSLSAGVPGLGFGGGRHPEPAAHGTRTAPPVNGHLRRLGILFAVFAALWAVPVAGAVVLGGEPFAAVARLFTTAAFVTFGGAYAVLPYIAEAGVETYGWLSPGEMINGLALAETTPGPLILVTTYVGYFAGWSSGGAGGPGPASVALLTAGLTTLVTFLPSFLFILAGAPYIERLQANPYARSALAAITAAVVGVILNLGVFLARAVFVPGDGVAWTMIGVAALAFALLATGRLSVPWLVAAGFLFGVASGFLT